MRFISLTIVMIMLAANIAVAGDVTLSRDTVRTAKTTYYDPIDYDAVRYNLALASRKNFLQRISGTLSQPLFNGEKIQLSSQFGIAYTQEVNLAFTAAATAQYKSGRNNALQSNASLSGMVSINGFFRVLLSGVNYFGTGKDKFIYDIGGGSLPVRFWGLGYDAANNNPRTDYIQRDITSKLRYMHRFARSFWLGVGVNMRYGKGDSFDANGENYLLDGGQLVKSAYTTGISLNAVYDTRNNAHSTTKGFYISLLGEVLPKALGNYNKTLFHIVAQADYFQPLWRGGVMAVDLYGDLWSSATPWFYWPSVGGASRMRGYYYGRYTDRKMLTAQLELRQTIYGPIGVCAWGGAGSIFDSHKNFDASKILPNYGIGLRLATAGHTALRIDYGFGRNSHGLIINVNEAF